MDQISGFWKMVISVGSGNEGSAAGHAAGILEEGNERVIEFTVQERQAALSIQLWKNYVDTFSISLRTPDGTRLGPLSPEIGAQSFQTETGKILIYYGKPTPYSASQEIYMDFLPDGAYIQSGVWSIILQPERIVDGRYDLWMPSQAVLNPGTEFLIPSPETTLTIPSTASRVVTVGAYNGRNFSYADFSGRGYTREENRVKPDLVAPGVDILTTTAGGSPVVVSGTSFSTPVVTGSAALLMEWGITRGNDPYLYGEKVKAYLRRGASKFAGIEKYPNALVGYGALCLRESLPSG